MTDKVEVKVTKAQREFFHNFAVGSVKNILGPILEFRGLEGVTPEVLDEVLREVDLGPLTEEIAKGFLERVDFATIKRVDKFMAGEDFAKVGEASAEVNALVQATLIEVIAPLVPLTPEEQEAKEAAKQSE